MLNNYISLPETESILQPPRINALAGAIHNSLNTWNTALGPAQMYLDSRARAIIINQAWYYFSQLALGDDPDITWDTDQGQRFLVVDERIILRFKLLDRNFESKKLPHQPGEAIAASVSPRRIATVSMVRGGISSRHYGHCTPRRLCTVTCW